MMRNAVRTMSIVGCITALAGCVASNEDPPSRDVSDGTPLDEEPSIQGAADTSETILDAGPEREEPRADADIWADDTDPDTCIPRGEYDERAGEFDVSSDVGPNLCPPPTDTTPEPDTTPQPDTCIPRGRYEENPGAFDASLDASGDVGPNLCPPPPDATPDPDPPTIPAVDIAAGGAHTCVVLDNGRVQCWGAGNQGQIGDGQPFPFDNQLEPKPSSRVQGITSATAVAAGSSHSCALLDNGDVQCWGANGDGQLGNGSSVSRSPTPVTVPLDYPAIAIAAGGDHTCAIVRDALVFGEFVTCWGEGPNGQLGHGRTIGSDTPVRVEGLSAGTPLLDPPDASPSSLIDISAGHNLSCAVKVKQVQEFEPVDVGDGLYYEPVWRRIGKVWCWGRDEEGELGDGIRKTGELSTIPTRVKNITSAVAVASGDAPDDVNDNGGGHNCALLQNGRLQCWGSGSVGQLGDGNKSYRNNRYVKHKPVEVTNVMSANTISANDDYTCTVTKKGTIKCWGRGILGRGKNNARYDGRTTPRNVKYISSATDVAVGDRHACALMKNGSVQCWGIVNDGRLGIGIRSDPNSNGTTVYDTPTWRITFER